MDDSPGRAQARRLTWTLFGAQSLGSAAFLSAATVNALVGAKLAGHAAWAGVPSAVYLLGSALSAFLWGQLMDPLGRRHTLTLGSFAGGCGALVAGQAVVAQSFGQLLLGMGLMGFAHSAVQLGRFVAAEVHPPPEKGRAIGHVVLGGTVGAILGPSVVEPAGRLASEAGLDELAGPYLGSGILLGLVAALLLSQLRPEPRDLARRLAAAQSAKGVLAPPARPIREVLSDPGVIVAGLSMVFAQVVMVMLMVITSLHMKHHDHSLGAISFVVSAHVLGMYAFSVLVGRLADVWGRGRVMLVGAAVLLAACLLSPLSPQLVPLSVSLFLLGLGWNLCYVGGSSLLADRLRPEERARTQGLNDFLISMTSAAGSFGSGVVFASLGFGAMGLVGAVASLLPLTLSAWWLRRRRPDAVPV